MKMFLVIVVTVLAFGCSRGTSYPYNYAYGALKVDGTEYYSVLIIQFKSDGIHVVGGFISDAALPAVTIGPGNSQETPLQIIPSQGVIVHNGERQTITNNGRLIWFVGGQTYEQTLAGFPLEEDIDTPKEIPKKPSGGDVSLRQRVDMA